MAKKAAKKSESKGEWYLIKNTVTGEKSITPAENFEYAQANEPKAYQWKKVSTHASEEEALSKL